MNCVQTTPAAPTQSAPSTPTALLTPASRPATPTRQPVGASEGAGPGASSDALATGVLKVSGMPRTLRPTVEEAMARLVRSESAFVVPGDDPLTAQWCTRWYRDKLSPPSLESLAQAGRHSARPSASGIGCHQVLTGTDQELRALDGALGDLAEQYGFSARVQRQ